MNLRGKECKTMNEYWGGPFFDDDGKSYGEELQSSPRKRSQELTCFLVAGQILRKDLLREGMKLADTVTELAGDEKELFLDFASDMLQWLPEKRKTAKELLEHPLLEDLREDQ